MNGFYVPGSVSSSYVANKRNEEGSLLYDTYANEVGIEKQAALQQLEKNYAITIENAYSNYLAANRGVEASNMGQGYKELYKQIQKAQLQQNIAQNNMNINEQITSLNTQESKAQQEIEKSFQTEVGYLDRLQQSFAKYFEYAKSLTDAEGNSYFDPYELNQSVDSMYDILSRAQPIGSYDSEGNYIGYLDNNGKTGMTYSEWIANQINATTEDQAWYQWFLNGGYDEFMKAPKSIKQWKEGELKAIREKELKERKEKERKEKERKEKERKEKQRKRMIKAMAI